ncbi:MAG: ACP S-malonyltransferase [Oscillospiraceae bacterium]|nr:ACP S-malonyltransferase [Oscillospiraceae bacterium]
MYNRAFLFNGIGPKYEKLLAKLTPEMTEQYQAYYSKACEHLGLHKDIEKNHGYDAKIAEWLVPFVCDRVIFEKCIAQGILPDIGVGYSSGIVSATACFGSFPYEAAYDIVKTHRSMLIALDEQQVKLDTGIIVGFSYDDLLALLRSQFSEEELVIGSSNSSFHAMISGKAPAVEKAIELCTNEGALKAFRLGTGTAFHHEIMKQYSQEYIQYCHNVTYKDPKYPMLSVFDMSILDTAEKVAHENQINVYTQMRWDLALKELEKLGVKEFIDISANGSLSKLSRVKRGCRIYTFEDVCA